MRAAAPPSGGLRVFADPAAAARALAAESAAEIRAAAVAVAAGRRGLVLGLPTGGSPLGLYREWARLHREAGLSFAGVTAFDLDEYWPAPAGCSFADYLREHLVRQVDLAPERIRLLDGGVPASGVAAECARHEAAIRAAGGVDCQYLGLGVNGHVGFNEPGSPPDSRTRRVALAPDTVARAARARAEWGGCREALTLGVGTILEARRIVVLAFGEEKAAAVARALRGAESADCPASFLRRHPDVAWVLDAAAAAILQAK